MAAAAKAKPKRAAAADAPKAKKLSFGEAKEYEKLEAEIEALSKGRDKVRQASTLQPLVRARASLAGCTGLRRGWVNISCPARGSSSLSLSVSVSVSMSLYWRAERDPTAGERGVGEGR
jgi:hypothetical protein